MDKYNINNPDWARGLIAATRKLNNLYGKKEVKKMSRPYFELKVVKVKKEKPEQKYCPCCGGKIEMEKPIGNWVNGENLDKIKFPVGCNWHIPLRDDDVQYGILMKKNSGIELHHIKQHNYSSIIASGDLKELIKRWDIHILKGKIILYEEII